MSIRCGHCKDRHGTVAEVRSCGKPQATRSEHVSRAVEGQAGTWGTPAELGVYRHQGRIFRVVIKGNGSGRPYAEEYVNGAYVYAKGMVFRLRPDERLSLAECKEWGRTEVRCIRCGTELTKPSSREAGIGPVCATKV